MINSDFIGIIQSSNNAGGGGPGGGGAGQWSFSPTLLGTNLSLSNDNRAVTNDIVQSNDSYVETVQAFPVANQVYYMEMVALLAANDPGNLGIMAVPVFQSNRDDNEDYLNNLDWSWAYQGGLFFQSGGSQRSISNFGGYDTGDVVMVAFNPSTGEVWVGENGVWESDPDVDPPDDQAEAAPPSDAWFRVVIGPVGGDASYELVTDAASLNYSPPAVATTLDTVAQPSEAEVDQCLIYTVVET